MVFVSAYAPIAGRVVYRDATGAETIRESGSRSWRNRNPANLLKGSFAEIQGAIGADTTFAIFPSEAAGRDAAVALFRTPVFRQLTLAEAIGRYAPPEENDTAAYLDVVIAETSLDPAHPMATMSLARLRAIVAAIRTVEGWLVGAEYPSGGRARPISSAALAAGDWMAKAEDEARLPAEERTAWPDPRENPRILEYFRIACPWFEVIGGDEVDWCAAFVNYCLERAGYRGSNHPGARSFFWDEHDRFLPVTAPRRGCIAVFRKPPFADPAWPTGPGHVGFVVDWTNDKLELLGGNQEKTVKRMWFPKQEGSGTSMTLKLVTLLVPRMN